MTGIDVMPLRRTPERDVLLTQLCQDLFSSFARSDQRRWGQMYVRGLIEVPGRKSIRRISENIVGWSAEQCLQQFVNQSPWAWEPVRCRLAQQVTTVLRPRAWVFDEVAFPKNGANSVGVARQYVRSAGRVLNCQVGLAAFLVGDAGAAPVDWRLVLPQAWDDDATRRRRSHLPEDERCRRRDEYLLELIDEMSAGWDLVPPPVVVDARCERRVEPLLRGLESRGLRYLVQVTESTPASSRLAMARIPTVGEVINGTARRDGLTLSLSDPQDGRVSRSQFITIPLPGLVSQHGTLPGIGYRGPRRILAEWSPGRRRSRAVWLTNLVSARLPDLIELVQAARRTAHEIDGLSEGCGLQHFEGRSFRGWHHHVTLASMAHAYRVLRRAEAQEMTAYRLRPHYA